MSKAKFKIQPEQPADATAIDGINRLAFHGRSEEANSIAIFRKAPEFQDFRVGQAMIEARLKAFKRLGHMIMLDHSTYFPRFGFSPELAEPLEGPFGDCSPAWMAPELQLHAREGVRGLVAYPPSFDGL